MSLETKLKILANYFHSISLGKYGKQWQFQAKKHPQSGDRTTFRVHANTPMKAVDSLVYQMEMEEYLHKMFKWPKTKG